MLLDELEDKSIYILREAFSKFERLAMLWSMSNDPNVLMCLAREAFLGREYLTPVHLDTDTRLNPRQRCFSRRDGYL